MNRVAKLVLAPFGALAGLMVSAGAFAQAATPGAPDITGISTAITSDTTSVTAIGGGLLVLLVAVAGFKWIKKAF